MNHETMNHESWKQILSDSICTGALASATTALAAAACGRVEEGEAVAPVNAVSHILWGDEAAAETKSV
jgi:hypothetical protein